MTVEVEHRSTAIGSFNITFVEGGLGAVRWQGIEVLRGAACLIRDANWGTYSLENFRELHVTNAGIQTIRQTFAVKNGTANVEVEITIDPAGHLELIAKITAKADLITNRAGLIVLHPIAETAGSELKINHPDGSKTLTRFPKYISPGQPAANIAGLNHTIGDINIDLQFEGEVFEMEDQRNWSDASYKTYCRPLSLPFPYTLKAGETVRQSLRLSVDEAAPTNTMQTETTSDIGTMPEILLAVERDWLPDNTALSALKNLAPQGLLLRVYSNEVESDIWQQTAQLAAELNAFVDLELVLTGKDNETEIKMAARHCAEFGLHPHHVIALPEIWLNSWQPGAGPSTKARDDCLGAAKAAFPNAKIGAGMLTNFTELNRYPPKSGDYITHANTAIVHAADDVSVWQTLEALPQIFQSGKAIAGARGYRLGLISIGMRTNPYGAALADNTGNQKKAMAGNDPRQTESFAAAYAIGATIEAAFGGIGAIALAAPFGRFGVLEQDNETHFPIYCAVQALANLAGQKLNRLADLPPGLTGIKAEKGTLLIANCSTHIVQYNEHDLEPGACLIDGARLS